MLDISRNTNISPTLLKKTDSHNNSNINTIPIKNETNIKYKNAFDILNNMNNNKYTLKYIEENRLRNKNSENDSINNISSSHKNHSPIFNNNNKHKIINRSSSYINKINTNEKRNKHKNRSIKKNLMKSNVKTPEKLTDTNTIHEYKINNMSSSYNNNYTNIKTNKIVFIDLKNNDILKKDLNNENQNNSNGYIRDNNSPEEEINENKINKIDNNNEDNKNLRISKIKNLNNNIINKNKFTHLEIQSLILNKSENSPNNCAILEDKSKNWGIPQKNKSIIKSEELKTKGLTSKEKSIYILSKSPVLRLCERMIFSRSSLAIRNILPKETIINEHYTILQKKIEELQKKIILCDKILGTPFTASKTADITLNFITSFQEIEFREYPIILSSDEEKKYYLNYLKILYNLLQEDIENKNKEISKVDQNNMILDLRKNLYIKLYNKGFKSLRDYLYNIFITKKDYIKEIPKIAEINYLVSQVNNMFEIHNSLKICKFISFTLYLVKEIVQFGNNIKSTVELKIKAKNLIDIINRKLEKYNAKYKNK